MLCTIGWNKDLLTLRINYQIKVYHTSLRTISLNKEFVILFRTLHLGKNEVKVSRISRSQHLSAEGKIFNTTKAWRKSRVIYRAALAENNVLAVCSYRPLLGE